MRYSGQQERFSGKDPDCGLRDESPACNAGYSSGDGERGSGEDGCFAFVSAEGVRRSFTVAQTSQLVCAVADALQADSVQNGGAVAVDLPNCPLFVFVLLACARMGKPVVALNHRLTAAEKQLRLAQLEDRLSVDVIVDEAWRRRFAASGKAAAVENGSRSVEEGIAPGEILQAADSEHVAIVMFTSGTTGLPKAAALTWRNLLASAKSANESLGCDGDSLWQAVLPLYHIGGLQVVLRSFLAGCPFLLYARFEAERVLADALRYGATHLSVVDKILQDLLACNGKPASADDVRQGMPRIVSENILSRYTCLLLGGSAPNGATLHDARCAGARVYASFGMTETASQVANCLVDDMFDGGLRLIPGVEARILDFDEKGVGELALRGASIINRYLNAAIRMTDDGFFVTGDRASMRNGLLYLHERVEDMFVSGGENVYPAEVERVLNQVEGVKASFVFGVPDETWGRRPVALVESALDSETVVARIKAHADKYLADFNRPVSIAVASCMPRMGIGKIDRAAARALVLEQIAASREQ